MTFDEILFQVRELLQREGRVSYRALKIRFNLDDNYLEGLKDELIAAKRLAVDEEGKVLVWTGGATVASSQSSVVSPSQPPAPQTADSGLRTLDSKPRTLDTRRQTLDSSAERRQLTVMFCDLVGSTALSTQLDPEELREVVQAYQETCTGVIQRYDGHIAQHLGDGLLVYFGYPAAHEDDAPRAVRTGLEIVAALRHLNTRLPHPLQVRIGIHTGLVVVGEIGGGDRREILALGETPNLAARLQGIAEPNTVVISAATQRLVQGLFAYQELGPQLLKGIPTPLAVYRVLEESAVQSRFEVAVRAGLTPLVGREEEVGLLLERWEQVKEGRGQVVLLSGEAGIGKSRLVQALKEHIAKENHTRLEARCSPYHQNSALHSVIELLQRVLQFQRDDSPEERLRKLEVEALRETSLQPEVVPLFASLLSLPLPNRYPPLTMTPQRQKQKIQEAVLVWLLAEAERQPVLSVWEDLHWADPSTVELLGLLLEQVPTARMLVVLTFRSEFAPPWANRSHLIPIVLSRLGRKQVETMIEQVTGGKALQTEVVQQIAMKTDGVPLFVEELTKMVVESRFDVGARLRPGFSTGHVPLPLGIPASLHDALMARLDRLGPAKEIAQIGATLGREFSHEFIKAVSPVNEASLQRALAKLVGAELLYQRGLPPQARYIFKHALIQDAAYESLLKSKRQQYHKQIAQVLEERFPETKETQPELLAHHCTEAGLREQAVSYWQKAGQRAAQRSANAEAINHLTKGLEVLKTLPDTPERAQHELTLQIALGVPLMATKGWAAPEVEGTYARARELCRRMGEIPQLFRVLQGLWVFYLVRAQLQTARELGEQLLTLAQRVQDPALFLPAYNTLGATLLWLGDFTSAREYLEQGLALYDPQKHRARATRGGQDPGVVCLSHETLVLWSLGYPDQALKRCHEALTLAQELSQPFSVGYVLIMAAALHQWRREGRAAQERAEALITLSAEQGFPHYLADGTIYRGWALAEQGQGVEGSAQIQQGMVAFRATGAELNRPYWLAQLAEVYGKMGRAEEGLTALAEALAAVDISEERWLEAELYRLKGTLTLQSKDKSKASPGQVRGKSEDTNTQHPIPTTPAEAEAEACFLKAIEIARQQSAKSLELRAVMSLARLWQKQGKAKQAHKMLAEIYNWFTEGFDTKDLQEAKALLDSFT